MTGHWIPFNCETVDSGYAGRFTAFHRRVLGSYLTSIDGGVGRVCPLYITVCNQKCNDVL